MRRKSHAAMGRSLLREYCPGLPRRFARLFLIGCVQPDGNPTTYLKGSLRCGWMRGHNYHNASRFIFRIANRLERKNDFSAWDYYTLGKLIHYIMDAFTLPHNAHFDTSLMAHRRYEQQLQSCFLSRLQEPFPAGYPMQASIEQLIRQAHERYLDCPANMQTDIDFAITVCCAVIQRLTENIPVSQKNSSFSMEKMLY